jgi:hypothetical protein
MSDNKIITKYSQKINPKNITNISKEQKILKSIDYYKTNTGNKIYHNKKIKKIYDKMLENNDLDIIHEIYLKLKNNQYENEDMIINHLIEEIKKNQFTDVQYFILALLIYRLINIDKFNFFNYPIKNRIHYNDIEKYRNFIFRELNTNNYSNKKIKSIIKASYNSSNVTNYNKLCIIICFIDEYIEVSKENSELREKITFLLSNFVKKSPIPEF